MVLIPIFESDLHAELPWLNYFLTLLCSIFGCRLEKLGFVPLWTLGLNLLVGRAIASLVALLMLVP